MNGRTTGNVTMSLHIKLAMTEVPYVYALCGGKYFYHFFDYRYYFGGKFYGNADAYVVVIGEVRTRPNLFVSWSRDTEGEAYAVENEKYPVEGSYDFW